MLHRERRTLPRYVYPVEERRFVEKLLAHSLKYDHVLYCMDNETSVTPKWGAYWSTLIRTKAAEAGKEIPSRVDAAPKEREAAEAPEAAAPGEEVRRAAPAPPGGWRLVGPPRRCAARGRRGPGGRPAAVDGIVFAYA